MRKQLDNSIARIGFLCLRQVRSGTSLTDETTSTLSSYKLDRFFNVTTDCPGWSKLSVMVVCSLVLRRLFIIISAALSSFYLVSSNSTGSAGKEDESREVILNHASEHYLAMIFHDYSDNASSRISTERLKGLLFDLKLGEKRPTSSDESTKHHHNRRSVRSRGVEQNQAQSRRRKRHQDEKQRDEHHQADEHLKHDQKQVTITAFTFILSCVRITSRCSNIFGLVDCFFFRASVCTTEL